MFQELEIQYTKKLKIILLFSLILIILFRVNNLKIININKKEKITGTVNSLLNKNQYLLKPNNILLMTDNNLKIGDIVKVDCLLKNPSRQSNFYLFDYQKYLLSKNIKKICYSNKINKLGVTNNIYLLIKRNIKSKIEKRKNQEYYKLFLLGSKEDIKKDLKDSFNQNGISHLFSISGMHITLIVLFLSTILKKIKRKQLIIIIFLFIYLLIANTSYSLIRSVILYIFMVFKNKFSFPLKNYHFLLLLALIIWLINPYCFYDLSFVFSFVITFFILRFSNFLKSKNFIISLFKLCVFCFLVSIPISIRVNYSINLLTPFFNMFFVPFVTYLFIPILIISFLFPFLDFILTFLINILEKSSLFLNDIDNFTLIFKYENIFITIIYYVIFYFVFKNCKTRKFIIVLVLGIHYFYPSLIKNDFVEILDVGQGDSILITLDNKHILVDTGGLYGSDKILNYVLLPSLKARGIKKLDYLILSHGDSDHMKESINLVKKFKVDKVIFNQDDFNFLEKELVKVLNKKKIKYYKNLKKINLSKYKLYFLNTKMYDNENDNSNVIYFKYYNYKFLLMGDASFYKEQDILNKYNLKDIDFLKVGHHGSITSSSQKFIDTIKPKYSLISVGINNKYNHPNKKVLDILKDSKIYRTDKNGSIRIKLDKNSYKISTCN